MRGAGCWLFLLVTFLLPGFAFSQDSSSANQPFDPVMGLFFKTSQIAFERAPANLVSACTNPARSMFWIYARAKRPEGAYMVIAGPVWTVDTDPPGKAVLDPVDSYGDVILVHGTKCRVVGDPDSMFNAPKPEQVSIVNDLAADLVNRAVRAYGGEANFLAALKAQEITSQKLDPVLRPLIARLTQK